MLLPIPPPIVWVTGSPFLGAVQAHLAVFRISRNFLAVIVGATPALAAGVVTHRLLRLIFGGVEELLTVPASSVDHTGGCRIPRSVMARLEI